MCHNTTRHKGKALFINMWENISVVISPVRNTIFKWLYQASIPFNPKDFQR